MEEILPNYIQLKKNDWTGIEKERIPKKIKAVKECCHPSTKCLTEFCENVKLKIECTDHDCKNQKILKKEGKLIYVKMTKHCGFGLFASEDIRKGDFILEYIGKVRLDEEYEKAKDDKYGFLISKDYVIDSAKYGNESRFINHSCDPNSTSQKWISQGLPSIIILAKKFIEKDEEIIINYGYFPMEGRKEEKCFCLTKNCSTMMGISPETLLWIKYKNEPNKNDEDESSELKQKRFISQKDFLLKEKFEDIEASFDIECLSEMIKTVLLKSLKEEDKILKEKLLKANPDELDKILIRPNNLNFY